MYCFVQQLSPTFLAPGTGFMEEQFSHRPGGVGGRGRNGSGGNVSDGSGSNAGDGEGQMKLLSLALPTTHLLLCGPVPNRPGGWGPLL